MKRSITQKKKTYHKPRIKVEVLTTKLFTRRSFTDEAETFNLLAEDRVGDEY
jgi:hypothetical protein